MPRFPLARDAATGCGRAAVIRIIAVLIVVPLSCLFLLGPMYLVMALDLSPWLLAVTAVSYAALLLGGGALAGWVIVRRRRAMLDAAFAPLGLEGGAYSTFFRQYHGVVQGRQVDVYLNQGPLLQIEVSTSLQTRLGVSGAYADTQLLGTLVGKHPLESDDPALEGLTLYPLDEGWARTLSADGTAVDALRRLVLGESDFTRQQVLLNPGTFKLMLSGNQRLLNFSLQPEAVQDWVQTLLALTESAERIPAPQITDQLMSVERVAMRLRKRSPYLALWVALGTIVATLGCAGVIIAAVLLLDRAP